MSTGADCTIEEVEPGQWYYQIQLYPYGDSEDYASHGPFPTEDAALKHLDSHYANPGAYNVYPYVPS